MRILRLGSNGGKGSAVAAGVALLLADPTPPEAIVVLDSDGQHDPERIPAFVEASRDADVVIGHRRERRSMPLVRRIANRAASLALLATTARGCRTPRTACGCSAREALREVPLPEGGYEAESRHLRALLSAGRTRRRRSRSRRSTTASRATTGRSRTRRAWHAR